MKYSEKQFNDLVAKFNSRELPKTEWTHEAHILVAFWHVSGYNENEALSKVRQAIRNYNTAVGTINSETSGYHETLTVFWLKIVRHFLFATKPLTVINSVNDFLGAGYADKTSPLQFYSNDRLFSKKARREWVDPDKISLGELTALIKQPNEAAPHLTVENP